jgi:hypothetical protein
VLAIVFAAWLGVGPLVLCGMAAAATRRLSRSTRPVADVAVRYAYALVPLGVGVWLAHYGFHLLTGAGTVVPVAQSAIADLAGQAWLGEPDWRWLGFRPAQVFPLQISVVVLGAMGGLAVVQAISDSDHRQRATRASLPWGALLVSLAVLAIWILAQPMEMRGVAFG